MDNQDLRILNFKKVDLSESPLDIIEIGGYVRRIRTVSLVRYDSETLVKSYETWYTNTMETQEMIMIPYRYNYLLKLLYGGSENDKKIELTTLYQIKGEVRIVREFNTHCLTLSDVIKLLIKKSRLCESIICNALVNRLKVHEIDIGWIEKEGFKFLISNGRDCRITIKTEVDEISVKFGLSNGKIISFDSETGNLLIIKSSIFTNHKTEVTTYQVMQDGKIQKTKLSIRCRNYSLDAKSMRIWRYHYTKYYQIPYTYQLKSLVDLCIKCIENNSVPCHGLPSELAERIKI